MSFRHLYRLCTLSSRVPMKLPRAIVASRNLTSLAQRRFSQTPIADPYIPPEDFKLMQSSLKAFSQYISLGKYAQAQDVLNEHSQQIKKYFPPDHPASFSVLNNQALLNKLNGKFLEAKEMFTEAYSKYSKLYGDLNPSTLNTLINLATVHKDLEEYQEAIIFYEQALAIRKQLEGEDSMNFAILKAMAAGAYRDSGKFDIADQYLKDAYLKIALEFGEDNIQAAIILNSMGLLYKKQGKFERSLDAYQRALKIREEQMGEGHPDTIATRHNIAELYITWVNPDKAQEYLSKNIEILSKLSNEDKKDLEDSDKTREEKYF